MLSSPTPNFTLDPQGIRGTATARRHHQLRQRKQWQTALIVALLIIGVAALLWWALQPRASGFATQNSQTLPLDLSAPATLDDQGNLWLSSRSGALWKVSSNGQSQRLNANLLAGAPPLVDQNRAYLPGLDGTLMAWGGANKTLWTHKSCAALATTPALFHAKDSAIVAVGDSDGNVFGLDVGTGKMRWNANLGGSIGDAIVVARDNFVVATLASGVWRGGLVSLDARTGRIQWRFTGDNQRAAGVAAAAFDSAIGRLYWNNDEGEIACLDAKTGRVAWRTSLNPDATMSVMLRVRPVSFRESVIVGGNDGALRSLNASDGKRRWTTPLKAPIRALYAAKVNAQPAILAVTEREIVLVDAATGTISGRDKGEMAWPLQNGQGAVIVGKNGEWRRVSW